MELLLKNVSVEFGDLRALDDVSLEVASGERVAVVGSSGAGKSTLFGTLTRGVPARGEVLVGGRDLYSLGRRELRRLRRKIGTIHQAYDLVPQLSAGMNVALGEVGDLGAGGSVGVFLRGPGRDLSRRVEEALAGVGLEGRSGSKTSRLSGGQQQRVAVARLLVQRPDLVLADEPFAAVDPVTGRRVLDLLLDLNRKGATLLVNLHDVELARRFPRVVALKDGRVVYDGPPAGLTREGLREVYAGEDPKRTKKVPENDARRSEAPLAEGLDGVAAH